MKKVIVVDKLYKEYCKNNQKICVLNNLDASFESGKFYAIMGLSGSGKSTLINILGLIDNEYLGKYYLLDEDVSKYDDKKLSCLRKDNIGFIFQNYLLDPHLTAYENVLFPLCLNKSMKKNEKEKRVLELLNEVGLSNRVNHFPHELSGGEQQRVAIARALVNNPSLILADEPTGNLDKKMENEIFSLLKKLSDNGKCIIVVSHSDTIKEYATDVKTIEDGRLI